MEPSVTETPPVLSPLTQRYCNLLNILTTSMNVLGWGTFALVFAIALQVTHSFIVFSLDFQLNLLRYSFQLLKFLVPASLLANLLFTFLVFSAIRKEYGGKLIYLKQLHWKNTSFIWGYISSLLYMAGCVLFIVLLLVYPDSA